MSYLPTRPCFRPVSGHWRNSSRAVYLSSLMLPPRHDVAAIRGLNGHRRSLRADLSRSDRSTVRAPVAETSPQVHRCERARRDSFDLRAPRVDRLRPFVRPPIRSILLQSGNQRTWFRRFDVELWSSRAISRRCRVPRSSPRLPPSFQYLRVRRVRTPGTDPRTPSTPRPSPFPSTGSPTGQPRWRCGPSRDR